MMKKIKTLYESLHEKCNIMNTILLTILIVAFTFGLVFGLFCLQGWVFMLLWNTLAVNLFGAKILGYWTCVGITFALHFLGKLIFGSVKSND